MKEFKTERSAPKGDVNVTSYVSSVFDKLFKFRVGQPVRFSGDGDETGRADMKMLVIARYISESVSSLTGERIYDLSYHCRVAKWSGSGDVITFSENELVSLDDYTKMKVEANERNMEHIQRRKDLAKAVYDSFGVERKMIVYLNDLAGNAGNHKYRVGGWETENGITSIRLYSVEKDLPPEISRELLVNNPKMIYVPK